MASASLALLAQSDEQKTLSNLSREYFKVDIASLLKQRQLPATCQSQRTWRRGRDSNPRDREAQRFSRPPQSTTLPPLRCQTMQALLPLFRAKCKPACVVCIQFVRRLLKRLIRHMRSRGSSASEFMRNKAVNCSARHRETTFALQPSARIQSCFLHAQARTM